MIKVAINGFGRIGRTFLRTLLADKKAQKKINIVAINIGPADPKSIALLFAYDTVMGPYPGTVTFNNNTLIIDKKKIAILAEKDPKKINWKKYKIDWVIESSGKFTKKSDAAMHQKSGAKRVLITAPAKNEDITIVPGVNMKDYNPKKDYIVSMGSCTTNAIVPMVQILHDAFGIKSGCMTTIHAYTNTQVLVDVETSDPRRSRAAALNIIPTSTGAARMIETVLPSMKGKISALAMRVPVAMVSLIEFSFIAQKSISAKKIETAFHAAAKKMPRIISVTDLPLVSSDYQGNPHSVVIDNPLTKINGNMGTVFGWYDNEWGYCSRLKDFLEYVAK